jgi:hypothetical protein
MQIDFGCPWVGEWVVSEKIDAEWVGGLPAKWVTDAWVGGWVRGWMAGWMSGWVTEQVNNRFIVGEKCVSLSRVDAACKTWRPAGMPLSYLKLQMSVKSSNWRPYWNGSCLWFYPPTVLFMHIVMCNIWMDVSFLYLEGNIITLTFSIVDILLLQSGYQMYIRRPFEKFVDSPYYSESELCGGAVMVSFSKYLPWQAMHFLQRSTYFSKTCCRPFATSFRRIVEQVVLTFHVRFSVSKELPPLENRSSSHCIVSIGLVDEL